MIEMIVQMLQFAKYRDSENIEIAKGKNKLPENWKEFKKQLNHIKSR